MAAKERYNEIRDEETDDGFLDDGAYDRYHGEDLSDDPMVADEKKKKKRLTRKEEKELARRLEEKKALKAEILAELEAERKGTKESAIAEDETEETRRRAPRFSSYLMSFLSGNILSKQEARKVYPYLLFIAFLAFVYIGNVFRMQHLYRKHERLTTEVKELRDRSMTIASEKMRATRQSNIIREIERRGLPLKESLEPNKTIHR